MKVAPAQSNKAPIIMIYGEEGRGKTSLACKFPNPVALLLERGLPRGVTVDAVEGVDSFEGVMAALRDTYTDPCGYRSLIIDTADMLEAHLLEFVCAKKIGPTLKSPLTARDGLPQTTNGAGLFAPPPRSATSMTWRSCSAATPPSSASMIRARRVTRVTSRDYIAADARC